MMGGICSYLMRLESYEGSHGMELSQIDSLCDLESADVHGVSVS
jgi:hypothetical protein